MSAEAIASKVVSTSYGPRASSASVTVVLDWGNAMYGDSLYDAAWLIYWWPWYPQWSATDISAELFAHWTASGTFPPNARQRLHAYLIHIGLPAIAYCAFRGRWDDVRANVDTVLALTAMRAKAVRRMER